MNTRMRKNEQEVQKGPECRLARRPLAMPAPAFLYDLEIRRDRTRSLTWIRQNLDGRIRARSEGVL
jgi:hypothetical protein